MHVTQYKLSARLAADLQLKSAPSLVLRPQRLPHSPARAPALQLHDLLQAFHEAFAKALHVAVRIHLLCDATHAHRERLARLLPRPLWLRFALPEFHP